MWRLAVAGAVVIAGLGLAAPGAKDPPKKEAPSPIGEWERENMVKDGTHHPTGPNPSRYTFTADGKFYFYKGKLDLATAVEGAYFYNPKADPPTIDLNNDPADQEGQISRGIYKIEGDKLTICIWRGRTDRPKAFESTADVRTNLIVLKRVKPKD